MFRNERGSALVGWIAATVVILSLVLGVVQVIFTLYASNVIRASAYEGVRAAIERGASDKAAVEAASMTVRESAGRLVENLQVEVRHHETGERAFVVLRASGSIRPMGMIPVRVPVQAMARSLMPEEPR